MELIQSSLSSFIADIFTDGGSSSSSSSSFNATSELNHNVTNIGNLSDYSNLNEIIILTKKGKGERSTKKSQKEITNGQRNQILNLKQSTIRDSFVMLQQLQQRQSQNWNYQGSNAGLHSQIASNDYMNSIMSNSMNLKYNFHRRSSISGSGSSGPLPRNHLRPIKSIKTSFSESPTFMLVSGITAQNENCLVADAPDKEGSSLHMEPCENAVRKMNGHELFRFMDNGALYTLMGRKCMSVANGDIDNANIELEDCDRAAAHGDGRSLWDPMPSSQLRLGKAGDQVCLSLDGPGTAGGTEEDGAFGAKVEAGSQYPDGHGPDDMVSGADNKYWASQLDPQEEVAVTIDLAREQKMSSLEINWEYPPGQFTIETSTDGAHFSSCAHVVDNNDWDFKYNGTQQVKVIRIILEKPHPKLGNIDGHLIYGIQKVSLRSHRLRPTVESCVTAAGATDARDKWFLVEVTEFNPCSNPALDAPPGMKASAKFDEIDDGSDSLQPGLPSKELIPRGLS